ncbi:MAG: hypothetical protein JSS72_05560 [Armatimonadetes bacterium]|nr:hypothetical protein [Armatimonadota bacterium]
MRTLVIAYDDLGRPPIDVQSIVGDKLFGQVLYRGKPLYELFSDAATSIPLPIRCQRIKDASEVQGFLDSIEGVGTDTVFLHVPSRLAVMHADDFGKALQRLYYADQTATFKVQDVPLFATTKAEELAARLLVRSNGGEPADSGIITDAPAFGLCDLGSGDRFVRFLANVFDTRYFNSVSLAGATVTKKSNLVEKICAEHDLYWLLPNELKRYFVMPYNLVVEADSASYQMERLSAPDLAIQWVNQALAGERLEQVLGHIFEFVRSRPIKKVESAQHLAVLQDVYLQKVKDRVARVEESPNGRLAASLLKNHGTDLCQILQLYVSLFEKSLKKRKLGELAIGHGDLCFSNILYSGGLGTIKLIDPKGARVEADLWQDPYYDLAKLSHSVLGSYDFINASAFDLQLSDSLNVKVKTFEPPVHVRQMFIEKLHQAGFDCELTRLYEASLFLSMLPLHDESPKKMVAFALRGQQILQELCRNG